MINNKHFNTMKVKEETKSTDFSIKKDNKIIEFKKEKEEKFYQIMNELSSV